MPFTFTIINAHTDPDEVGSDPMGENELNVLADIYEIVRSYETQLAGEDDFLLVGDLNAPRGQLMRLGTVPGLESVAPPGPTMVRETGEYDHILVDTTTTTEFTGTAAVVSLQEAFELSREQALTISDHRPVYAEFSAFEAPRRSPAVAGDARTLRR
jgi:endonuclease/exonuclease/phosphatase (EEP) superfamily protein YafD